MIILVPVQRAIFWRLQALCAAEGTVTAGPGSLAQQWAWRSSDRTPTCGGGFGGGGFDGVMTMQAPCAAGGAVTAGPGPWRSSDRTPACDGGFDGGVS